MINLICYVVKKDKLVIVTFDDAGNPGFICEDGGFSISKSVFFGMLANDKLVVIDLL